MEGLAVKDVKTIEAASLLFFGSQADIDSWRQSQLEEERASEQGLDTTNYENHSQHSQATETKYIQTGCANHTNTSAIKKIILAAGHSQYGRPYSQSSARSHSASRYSRTCDQTNSSTRSHSNHSNHSQCSNHGNHSNCNHVNSGVNDHVNYSQQVCTDSIVTQDIGFDHQNYIPSQPQIYELGDTIAEAGSVKATGTYQLQISSYDKNADGAGTQNAVSKDVEYKVTIKKVKDRDGNPATSAEHTLANWATSDIVSINTFSPLGTVVSADESEGVYEMTITAQNEPQSRTGTISENGVVTDTVVTSKTYVSATTTVYMTILHDTAPTLSVINANEFNGADFGLDGRYLDNIFKAWGSTMYSGGNASQQAGILVQLKLTDVDEEDYHSGTVYLRKSISVLTNKIPITWVDTQKGSTVVRTGYAFIPETDMVNDGTNSDISIVAEVQTYKDAACTQEKNVRFYYSTVSEGGASMLVDIDVQRPDVSFNPTPMPDLVDANGINNRISLSFVDSGLGVRERYYQVIKETVLTGSETYNDADWVSTANDLSIICDEENQYMFWAKVIDNAGNVTFEKSGVYKISPIELDVITDPAFPLPSWRRGTIDVSAVTETSHNIIKCEAWLVNDETATKVDMATLDAGNRKRWNGTIRVPDGYDIGDSNVIVRAYTDSANNATVYTKQSSVQIRIAEAPASSLTGVRGLHTAEWDTNRLNFNSKVSVANQRAVNVFWSGEKILVEADVTGIVDSVNCEIVGEPDVAMSNLSYDINPVTYSIENVKCELWDESMIDRWGRSGPETKTIRLTVKFFDWEVNPTTGTMTIDLPVVFDNKDSYWNVKSLY